VHPTGQCLSCMQLLKRFMQLNKNKVSLQCCRVNNIFLSSLILYKKKSYKSDIILHLSFASFHIPKSQMDFFNKLHWLSCNTYFHKLNLTSWKVLPPFQIIGGLTFLTPSLTTRLIQKFVENITYFVVGCFINTRFSRMTQIWQCLRNFFE